MKLGVFAVLFAGRPLDEALDYITQTGLEAVEIGAGNYPGDAHCPVDELLSSPDKRKEYLKKFSNRKLEISAISVHGNPLHPDKSFAKRNHDTFVKGVKLAAQLGVKNVIAFSGCPGDAENARYPNWVTCPWPPDFSEVLKWQWDVKVIPYWSEQAEFARKEGVRIAFEMHPGFVVYNTETMLRLRKACGNNLGANFDPSHLFWQGMDPLMSIRALGKAIFHVHAKDCRIDPANTAENGVLDTKPYSEELKRSWVFRTIGYGHGREFWCDFVSHLRMVGYDGVLSIEHEDSIMSVDDGFKKAVAMLQDVLLHEKPGAMWWA